MNTDNLEITYNALEFLKLRFTDAEIDTVKALKIKNLKEKLDRIRRERTFNDDLIQDGTGAK